MWPSRLPQGVYVALFKLFRLDLCPVPASSLPHLSPPHTSCPQTDGGAASDEADWINALLLSEAREHVKAAFEDEAPGTPWATAKFQVWGSGKCPYFWARRPAGPGMGHVGCCPVERRAGSSLPLCRLPCCNWVATGAHATASPTCSSAPSLPCSLPAPLL